MSSAYLGDELRALRSTLGLTELGQAFMAKHAEIFGDALVSAPAQDATALANCPFCGGHARLYQRQNAAALWHVACENCDAGPHSDLGKYEAIARWNTRATSQTPDAVGLMQDCRDLIFGALVENIAASDCNPIKRGIFIRKTSAKMAEYATKEGCHSTPLDNLRNALSTPSASTGPQAEAVWPTDDQVWDCIRLTFAESIAAKLSFKRWKDGIDIDYPTSEAMSFARQLFAMGFVAHPQPQQADGLSAVKAAGLKTCLDEIGLKITIELYNAVKDLKNASPCLLAMIGSWGDTLDDADVLSGLQRQNEMGECFIPEVSGREPWSKIIKSFRRQIIAADGRGTVIEAREPGFVKPDNDQQVFFYEQDFYVLSNFSAFNVMWRGIRFQTSEHAYHFERFWKAAPQVTAQMAQDFICNTTSAHEAFRFAQDNKGWQRKDWDAVKVDAMRAILRAKADQHEYVRRKLLASGDRELIEDSWRDDFWGWGPNRDGKNMLGKLWMEVRAALQQSPETDARPRTINAKMPGSATIDGNIDYEGQR